MSQDEALRMVAAVRDQATGPLRKVRAALRDLNKSGSADAKQLREHFRSIHEQLGKVAEVARTGVSPALDAIGLSSLSAVGAMAALVAGLKKFADQGADVSAFGRKVQLTTDTIRGLEGAAGEFHVDPTGVRSSLQGFAEAMFLIRRHQGAYRKLLAQDPGLGAQLATTPETVEGNERALRVFLNALEANKRAHGEPNARAWAKEVVGGDEFVDMLQKDVAGLDEATAAYLRLAGAQNAAAGKEWEKNWTRFSAAVDGVRNEIGNALLPDMTALAIQAKDFLAEHKVEIARDIVTALRDMGAALSGINSGVQAIGGWKIVFEGLIALKLLSLATNIGKVAASLGLLSSLGSPPAWVLGILAATGLAATLDQQRGLPGAAGAYDTMLSTSNPDMLGGRFLGHQHLARILGRSRTPASAAAIIQGLRDRGLDPMHAAIMGGNIQQESNFDPTKPNYAEGGIGLIQWRLERRAALKHLAGLRHKAETDAATQLDFLMQELSSTPAGRDFLAAQSPDAMNKSLHHFIRYGDDSEAARLQYGRELLGTVNGTVTGSASLDVNVTAPKGTSVKAGADGLFNRVTVNRGHVTSGDQ